MTKWAYVYDGNGLLDYDWCDTKEEAIRKADLEWNKYLTPAERKRTHVYAALVDPETLEEYDTVEVA